MRVVKSEKPHGYNKINKQQKKVKKNDKIKCEKVRNTNILSCCTQSAYTTN